MGAVASNQGCCNVIRRIRVFRNSTAEPTEEGLQLWATRAKAPHVPARFIVVRQFIAPGLFS